MFTTILGAVFLIGFLSFAMNGGGQAEAPEWEVGDEWSMGYETDLGEMLTSMIGELEDEELEELGDIDSDIEGKAGYYMVFKVAEATDTQYTMDIATGGGVEIDGNGKVTMEMPKEGEYTYDSDDWDYEPPMESMEISIDLVLDLSLKIDGTAHFTKDELKLEDLEMVMVLKGSVDLEVVNFPEINYDYNYETDEETIIVEYTDYELSGSADIKLTLNMEFDPPLDIFNFPIEEDEGWWAESMVTVSGAYEGVVDADGIPEEIMEEMAEENVVFPLILEELDTGIDEVKEGAILESEFPLSIPMACTGTETVELADGSSREAYVIQFGEEEDDYYEEYYDDDEYYYDDDDWEYYEEEEDYGSALSDIKFLYCPDEGFFVSAQMEGMGDGLGLDGMTDSMDTFELKPMDTDDAEKNMGVFKGESSSDDDGPGIFLWGLIVAAVIVVLVIIAVVIAVILMKKKK
jgi:hypothetical protein